MDLRRVRLHWTLGARDDERGLLADEPLGLIPTDQQEDTLVIFNGGFQLRHGRWGIQARGIAVQALKDEGCVVGIAKSGERVELGSWSRFSQRKDGFDVVRQTPPCLLENGAIHPDLEQGKTRPWAGQATDRRTRRRSALGIDEAGTTLYYAVGTETEPIDLARGLKAVGAVYALQLDINWNWTRFLVPGRAEDGVLRVASSLIDGMAWDKNEYFSRPSARDFFYVTRSPDTVLSAPGR